tara:strand:- start:1497 stop:2576 length:1080 start_codon:yes stop_codon:yes gene_type:complete
MTSNKINIALLGCGRISKSHINAIFSEKDRCNLVAICDESKEKLKSALKYTYDLFLEKGSSPPNLLDFTNLKELLSAHQEKKIKIDLLIIATPSGLHSSQTINASEYGINICTEKPMALNVKDGLMMINKCLKNNVKLFVVKQNRLNTTLLDLREKIKEKKFGKIGIVALNVFWHRPQSYYDQDNWRGTEELDGGALMNQASHYIDLLEWMIGPIKSLSASIATISRKIESEDTAVLNLKWLDGTLGSMAVTMITFPKNIEGSITIIGDKGSAKVGGEALNKYEFFYFDDEVNEEKIKKSNYKIKNVYGSGHYDYYRNMLDVLIDKKEAICDGESGLSSIKIIKAAYLSSKSGKEIYLR